MQKRQYYRYIAVEQIPTELQMEKKRASLMRLLEGTAEAGGMRMNVALAEAIGVLVRFSRATGPGTVAAGKQTWRN